MIKNPKIVDTFTAAKIDWFSEGLMHFGNDDKLNKNDEYLFCQTKGLIAPKRRYRDPDKWRKILGEFNAWTESDD